MSIGSFSPVLSDLAVANTVASAAGPIRVEYSSSLACSHFSGRPFMIGCSASRVSTTKEKNLPCVPPPPLVSCSILPSRQRSMVPDLSLRPPHPPTAIILLYSSHFG